ncbi:eukaryotic translation initiation factor 3 subunit i [Anaeramoeba flamelloides]|uniref:Serine-threonine kinase receptor-associated protein n=1 Tax=Anaeramoeba flamelloides TaxID=1746091 RepID=A0AAV8AAR4_9EUKA|nr:eukaryotic translation initiation factor 3 subunit i [Anaeramoeba flamelloides]
MTERIKTKKLQEYERSITYIKFRKDGERFFTASWIPKILEWDFETGQVLQEFNDRGRINEFDLTKNHKYLITVSAVRNCTLWNTFKGEQVNQIKFDDIPISVKFSYGEKLFMVATRSIHRKASKIHIFKFDPTIGVLPQDSLKVIEVPEKKRPTSVRWGNLNKTIIGGCVDGYIRVWKVSNGELVKEKCVHEDIITSISFSADHTHFITASADCTAKIIDEKTLDILKVYESDRSLNTAEICPRGNLVVCAGGQRSEQVAQSADEGKFTILYFDKIQGELIGSTQTHYSSVHSIAFHPTENSFISGCHQGDISIHYLDNELIQNSLL